MPSAGPHCRTACCPLLLECGHLGADGACMCHGRTGVPGSLAFLLSHRRATGEERERKETEKHGRQQAGWKVPAGRRWCECSMPPGTDKRGPGTEVAGGERWREGAVRQGDKRGPWWRVGRRPRVCQLWGPSVPGPLTALRLASAVLRAGGAGVTQYSVLNPLLCLPGSLTHTGVRGM